MVFRIGGILTLVLSYVLSFDLYRKLRTVRDLKRGTGLRTRTCTYVCVCVCVRIGRTNKLGYLGKENEFDQPPLKGSERGTRYRGPCESG